MNQSTKIQLVPKVFKPMNEKSHYKTLGTGVINIISAYSKLYLKTFWYVILFVIPSEKDLCNVTLFLSGTLTRITVGQINIII